MGRTLGQIQLQMMERERAIANADIHDLLRQEKEVLARVTAPIGNCYRGIPQMVRDALAGVAVDEMIIGWLVANVPADLLAQAAQEANLEYEDYPLV